MPVYIDNFNAPFGRMFLCHMIADTTEELLAMVDKIGVQRKHWEYFHCVRCWNVVGYVDNSRFIHALECKENNYDPTF